MNGAQRSGANAQLRVCWAGRLCLLVMMTYLSQASAAEGGQDQRGSLNLAFSSAMFADVNADDALAATKVWASAIVERKKLDVDTSTAVLTELPSLVRSARNRVIDVAILTTREFIDTRDQTLLDASFVTGKNGRCKEESLLVVLRRSGVQSVDGLQGRKIHLLMTARANMGRLWLESLIHERRFMTLEAFFGKVAVATKHSQAVLPVYFGQSDACLVTRDGFETMAELNPQLRSDLQAIAVSPPLVTAVIGIRRDYRPDLKAILVDALGRLHEEPKGQQILTLFKIDRLVPFQETYLQSAKELLANHQRLEGQIQGRGRGGRSDTVK